MGYLCFRSKRLNALTTVLEEIHPRQYARITTCFRTLFMVFFHLEQSLGGPLQIQQLPGGIPQMLSAVDTNLYFPSIPSPFSHSDPMKMNPRNRVGRNRDLRRG
jgi:hypothetical protein